MMQTRRSLFCRALQVFLVTCTFYFFYATVLEKAREASWSDAVSDFVRRSLSDGVFGHIGNRTLGVSLYEPCRQLSTVVDSRDLHL